MQRAALAAVTIACSTVCASTFAGPLSPPAGPIGSTNTALVETDPRTPIYDTGSTIVISSPGSYYLAEAISSDGVGVRVEVTGVTLDLNGYSVMGNLSGNNFHHAIELSPIVGRRPIVVRNGFIHRFSGAGVSAPSGVLSVVLENVHISDCENEGIAVGGNLKADGCTVVGADGDGFFVFGEALISDCVATVNAGTGFRIERGTIRNCSASGNGESGFELGFLRPDQGSINITDCVADTNLDRGFYVDINSVISGCLAINNSTTGFQTARDVSIDRCAARFNTQWGFHTGLNTAIANCVAGENGNDGFNIGSGSGVSNCGAYQNGDDGFNIGSGSGVSNCGAYQNGEIGFHIGLGSSISDCGARDNDAAGFEVGAGSSIINCGSTANGTDGFLLQSDTRVFHCTADGNGTDVAAGAGIRSVSDCIIDSCHVTDNDIGIQAATGTLTVRCSAAGNAVNYDFAAGAEYGAIIAGTPGFTSSNAWANIEF